jgi:elongation factor P
MAIRFENQMFKVVGAVYQPGQGKMGGVMHARLQNLSTGNLWEHGFRSELKLEDIALARRAADFLYIDGNECLFMDPDSFEQYVLPMALLGKRAQLLTPDMRVQIELVDGHPVSVQLPEIIEVKVQDTAPPVHNSQDNTWKTATLENGIEILVPPFIKTGDRVRVDGAELKYMDRSKPAVR